MTATLTPVVPTEGCVLHLFYKSTTRSGRCSPEEQRAAKTHLSEVVQEVRRRRDAAFDLCMVSPKPDLGFMLLTPDLHRQTGWRRNSTSVWDLIFSLSLQLSLDDRGESMKRRGICGTAAARKDMPRGLGLRKAMAEFSTRMTKYRRTNCILSCRSGRFCFINVEAARPGQNWYGLPFEEPNPHGRARPRRPANTPRKILQLITGSTGLDDAEWGSHSLRTIRSILKRSSEMRFWSVSTDYADFGGFTSG
jgi:chlorite dismutase